MALLTQQFLESNTLAELTTRYAIAVKRHPQYPNLVFLKYSQIDSPMAEPIVQECRGLILDESDDWRTVSFPFRKFFNHGEGHAAPIDWATAKVYEKLDGSLMTLYSYRGVWHVASNGLPDAGGDVWGHGGTFAELFWETFYGHGLTLPPDNTRSRFCFMFELMTPHNRVVVPHTQSRLALIGVRGLATFDEHRIEDFAQWACWPRVASFPLQSFADVITAAATLRPMESEGYVVCDANFNRVKVKSPQYVALAHMKDQFSARRMLEVVRLNESAEFLTYFPEMKPLYDDIHGQFSGLCAEVEADYARLAAIAVQKDFAIEAMKTRCSGALFALRAKKHATARDYFAAATLPSVERLIKCDMDYVVGVVPE